MTALKVTKYNLNTFKNSAVIFYSIFIAFSVLLGALSIRSGGNVSSSGTEFSTIIYIFIFGLNIFKESFYFLKGSNVSRKNYLVGTALSMLIFSGVLSLIDLIINRLYNIFVESPMLYDMTFGNFNSYYQNYWIQNNWIQNNDIITLVGSFLLQWGLCLFAISLGFLINLMYYRANKLVKTLISISPAILIILINFLNSNFRSIIIKINNIISEIYLIQTKNIYSLFTSLLIVFLIGMGTSYLLVRRATIKE